MESLAKLMISPHIHSEKSTSGIMLDVLIALLPATFAGTVIFGWRALLVIAVCVICSVAFEAIFNLFFPIHPAPARATRADSCCTAAPPKVC